MVTIFRSLEQTVSLVQYPRSNILGYSLNDIVSLDQTIVINIIHLEVTDHIILGQEINNPKILQVVSNILLTDNSVLGKVHVFSTSHIINLGQIAKRTRVLSLTQNISLGQNINQRPIPPSVILINQNIDYSVSQPIIHNLNLNQIIDFNKIKVFSISHNINLASYPRMYKLNYHYFALDIPILPPYNHKIILTYGVYSIQLRNPEFEDVHHYEQSRILRRNRGGELNIFRDKNLPWPETETLSYSFKGLLQAEASRLLYFMNLSLGKLIRLTDHEGNIWEGIITTPAKEIVQEDIINFNASFDFQGNKL